MLLQVSAEALQSLKQGQAQLSSSSTKAIKELQRQQQALQQQIQAQQQQVQALRQLSTALQRQQRQQQADLGTQQPLNGTSTAADGSDDSSCSSGVVAIPPDPWRPQHAAGTSIGGNSSSQFGNSSQEIAPAAATNDSSRGSEQGPSSNGHAPSNGIPSAGLNGASQTTAAAAG